MHTTLSDNVVEEGALEAFQLANVSFENLREKDDWPMFELGETVISPQAVLKLTVSDMENGMHQHGNGSWGKLNKSEWKQNDFRLSARMSVTSVYEAANGTIFMVHTDFDRRLTEVLLPSEL